MKREIKFRALDAQSKKFTYGHYVNVCNLLNDNRGHRMVGHLTNGIVYDVIDIDTLGQFTGKKDCKGKEIYDGDIIKVGNYTMYDGVYFVEWHNEINAFVFKRNLVSPILLSNAKNIEVIGNIYENSELLKTT